MFPLFLLERTLPSAFHIYSSVLYVLHLLAECVDFFVHQSTSSPKSFYLSVPSMFPSITSVYLCACTCLPVLEQSCEGGAALSICFLNRFQDVRTWIILRSFSKIKTVEVNSDNYDETRSSEMVMYEVEIDAEESGRGEKEDAGRGDSEKKDRAECLK